MTSYQIQKVYTLPPRVTEAKSAKLIDHPFGCFAVREGGFPANDRPWAGLFDRD